MRHLPPCRHGHLPRRRLPINCRGDVGDHRHRQRLAEHHIKYRVSQAAFLVVLNLGLHADVNLPRADLRNRRFLDLETAGIVAGRQGAVQRGAVLIVAAAYHHGDGAAPVAGRQRHVLIKIPIVGGEGQITAVDGDGDVDRRLAAQLHPKA